MSVKILEKYNIPVPRYTSYPPANYFTENFSEGDYIKAIEDSNKKGLKSISFYIHIPFCYQLCHYCGCNSVSMQGKRKLKQYKDALIKEIKMLKTRLASDRPISQIHYGGGSPTVFPVEWLKELNELLLAEFPVANDVELAIECHPGYLDENYWKGLLKAGFNRFSIGVQDFNPEVLKTVNRLPAALPMEKIFEILRNGNASINLDFIYGLPLQTEARFIKSIEQALTLSPDRMVTFSYAHLPSVNARQRILDSMPFPSEAEKQQMYKSAKKMIEEARYKTIGLDHFVKEEDELYQAFKTGELHRNFQGYCSRRNTGQVYAVGVSGISQLHTAYAQNTKNLDLYLKSIGEDKFPIIRGYILNEEEQITREVI
ncbi:MAG: oxygen-independent coproporphyrinogen III oxidase, partial [Odoribacter sp.]|nr:oxygen-independent coproporphyrinogen III oxidase [Odoribacter sp.]